MSKHDLSMKQLDERTDYFKSKVESLSQTMTENSVPFEQRLVNAISQPENYHYSRRGGRANNGGKGPMTAG